MIIEHIAIWTPDLELLRAFYEKYFQAKAGAKYTNPKRQFESYFLSFPSGPRLELMQMPSTPSREGDPETQYTGYTHLALAVGSQAEVDGLTGRLCADGFRVVDGSRRTGDGYYESVVLDPDGNRIEITI